jgi:two-component sensor histidine kinase
MNRLAAARRPISAYSTALALVLAGFTARFALEPVFGANHTYTAFYPVVILTAYFLGAGPAIVSAVLSVALAYWFFAPPILTLKTDFTTLASVTFFAFTATVSIYFITGMARALRALAEARSRAEGLAKSHAELFGELNERVTNHLQLVAALLRLQARDERDQSMARALAEASARTLLISRVHRSVAGETQKTLDFDAFARQLMDATLAARGHPPVQVEIEAQGLQLPLDQATSVAIVLLECVNARLQLNTPATLRVRLRGDDLEATLEVSETSDGPAGFAGVDLARHAIEAMVEQLGGRFSYKADAIGAVSALVFPRPVSGTAAMVDGRAGQHTLH